MSKIVKKPVYLVALFSVLLVFAACSGSDAKDRQITMQTSQEHPSQVLTPQQETTQEPAVNSTNNQAASSGGGSILYGEDGPFPTIFYQGALYEWIRLYYDPNRIHPPKDLPAEFEYIGDITHIEEREPTEDLQFVSWFDVSGAAYRSEDTPDIIVVFLTTSWLKDTAVVFHSDPISYFRQSEGMNVDEFFDYMEKNFPDP